MTRIEKIVLIIIILLLLFICGSVYKTVSAINEAGGIKQIIIETGKEIKDISNQIDKDK